MFGSGLGKFFFPIKTSYGFLLSEIAPRAINNYGSDRLEIFFKTFGRPLVDEITAIPVADVSPSSTTETLIVTVLVCLPTGEFCAFRIRFRHCQGEYASHSPDSDDTYFGDDSEEGRDDQYLVSDRCESKFYGSVHGGSTAGSTAAAGGFSAASANITRSIKAATYLCPAIFPWVDMGPATEESGMVVLKLVGVFYVLIIVFDVLLVFVSSESSTFVYILLYALLIAVIAVLGAISRKPQNKQILVFKTPWVPFVPSFSIAVNLYLIFQLSSMTLLRIVVWVSIGLFVYFYYGIKHSTLEPRVDEDERIELKMKSQTMTKPQNNRPPAPAKTSANTNTTSTANTANTTTTTTATAASTRVASSATTASVVDENKTEPKRPTNLEPLPANNDSNLFVSPSAFPKWED
ncbi:unnamed protein product [Macrosiphum euphorbiae]|uniref:Cationic amino acid transporter C-terminal domain-containing protein n=1 Tax=Macrosiphum euphorbiae TaxID=13131 RepID=A0AAV0XI86_9HEMI|nr:unnamed protein product [Macrosiphum euphorbiae]